MTGKSSDHVARLLVVSSEFPPGPGGIGTHAYQLSRQLCSLGWSVTAVAPQDYVDAKEARAFNDRQGFRIIRLPSVQDSRFRRVRRIGLIQKLITRENPTVVMATGERAVWLTSALAQIYSFPWVAIGHGAEFGATRAARRTLTKWAFSHATAAVCVSNYTHERMLQMGARPARSTVIHNGADSERFTILGRTAVETFRGRQELPAGRLLLTVGRVTDRKGQDIIIKALPGILRHVPDTHYLIAGLPERKDALYSLAKRLGVEQHVHFLGRVSEDSVVHLHNCSDLFAMTSRHTEDGDFEGFGIAVVEAALCGKPAVVSDRSGLAEAIVHNVTGLGVPEEDVPATEAAIVSLLTDRQMLETMGREAHQRAVQGQTWERRARDYDALLRSVCRDSRLDPLGGTEFSRP